METAPDVPTVVVVMGVGGSGKSTVDVLLAERLALPFLVADDPHPATNRAKMPRGGRSTTRTAGRG
ncbi:hypothetical protein [Streptomyces sp. LN549]|uniref:hypothetical protein n=1 Tax=Streptomyces sp. LN549 TaxID=3112979 RepID=UPI003713DD68